MWMRILVGLTLGSLVALGSPPDSHELMCRSVKVAESNWLEAPNYSFLRTNITSKKDSRPATNTSEVLMIDGSPYSRLVAEDGRPLSQTEALQEEQKLRKEFSKRSNETPHEQAKRVGKYMEERNHDHALLMELAEAFNYTVSAEQIMDGREVWVLNGTPKPGYVPKSRGAQVLSGMDVTFWIDKASYQWLRVEAEVNKRISVYGFLAKVGSGTKFMLEQQPVSGSLWLPRRVLVQVKASVLGFLNEDSIHDQRYSDYTPAGSAVSAMQTTTPTENPSARIE